MLKVMTYEEFEEALMKLCAEAAESLSTDEITSILQLRSYAIEEEEANRDH